MKKILSFVLLTTVFFLLVKSVNAVSPTVTPVNNEVEYTLAYPGLLPDHPLYPLKVIRDKIYDFFLSDLVKKSEFKLLMADKRLFMAIMLKDRQKIERRVGEERETEPDQAVRPHLQQNPRQDDAAGRGGLHVRVG